MEQPCHQQKNGPSRGGKIRWLVGTRRPTATDDSGSTPAAVLANRDAAEERTERLSTNAQLLKLERRLLLASRGAWPDPGVHLAAYPAARAHGDPNSARRPFVSTQHKMSVCF